MDQAFWATLVPFATVVSAIVAAFALGVGAFSLRLIARQTREASRAAQRSTAFDAHKEYLRFCIEHPQLSSSYMMLRYIKRASFKDILDHGTVETEKALWFLSYVLFAMEEALTVWADDGEVDPAWEETVIDQLGYHAALLVEVWPEWKRHYSARMDRAVAVAVTKDDPLSMKLRTRD